MAEIGKGKHRMIEKLNLTEKEIMLMIEGTVKVFVNNSDYFYHSGVGPQYSKITPEGQQMLIKSMGTLLPLLADAQSRALDERAKSITWNSLQEEDIQ
jgi:hypothetical protein